MAQKIGIEDPDAEDRSLGQSLLEIMAAEEADFTLTFRHLAGVLDGNEEVFFACFTDPTAASPWLDQWQERMKSEDRKTAIKRMRDCNPVFIPRNHRIEEVIAAGYEGDFAPFHRLHEVLQDPFSEQADNAEFENAPTPGEVVCATFCGT